jgi:nucleoid-associated protein YgaU
MQKDFKIGLAIGVTFAAGAILWLATLPNLSARARALHAASNITPSPNTSSIVSQAVSSPQPTDTEIPASDEPRVTSNKQSQRIHVVQKGDTLSSISAKYYGSSRQWRKILTANRDNLPDPNRLTPGSKLIIPQ